MLTVDWQARRAYRRANGPATLEHLKDKIICRLTTESQAQTLLVVLLVSPLNLSSDQLVISGILSVFSCCIVPFHHGLSEGKTENVVELLRPNLATEWRLS